MIKLMQQKIFSAPSFGDAGKVFDLSSPLRNKMSVRIFQHIVNAIAAAAGIGAAKSRLGSSDCEKSSELVLL